MHDFFKVLADETRLRCLSLIYAHNEVCVCEFVDALQLPQSKISRHLAILKLNQVISQRRDGQWMLYSLHPDLPQSHYDLLTQSLIRLKKETPYLEDNERFAYTQRQSKIAPRQDATMEQRHV